MKASIQVIFMLFLFHSAFAQKTVIDKLDYDKVVMYKFEGGKGGDRSVMDKDGVLAKTISMQAVLDAKSVNELNIRLNQKKSYGNGEAACYEPRLGFIYYKADKMVAKVDVCTSCNRLVANFPIPVQQQCPYVIDGETIYMCKGISDSFKSWLNVLTKKYGF